LGLLHAHALTRHLGGELRARVCDSDVELTLTIPTVMPQ